MGQKLRGKILDVTSPGWRERPLMASVLAHQERIRNDPKIQAIRKKVDRESVRFMRAASAGFLLLPIVLWLIARAAGTPMSAEVQEFAAIMYGAWIVGVAVLYRVTTADD
jgi:hypothetical protein